MCIPLIVDVYIPLFSVADDSGLSTGADAAAWILLMVIGIFFTLGSGILVRAFESPAFEPMLSWVYHFQTDELIAAWLFFIASIPTIPYVIIYIAYYPSSYTYYVALFMAIIFVSISGLFVLGCYPVLSADGSTERDPIIYPYVKFFCCGDWEFIKFHLGTDFLFASWVFYWGTCICTFACFVVFLASFATRNGRQIYTYGISFIDFFIFLVGCAYFVAGAYAPGFQHDKRQVKP